MHELSIALSLIDAAAEESQRIGATRVVAVHLKVGPLSGVVLEALENAYDIACTHSPLADSHLVIEPVPVTAFCPNCSAPRAVESLHSMRCVECGEYTREIITGRELEVTALEVVE